MEEKIAGIRRKMVGYHQDRKRGWVAELECGYQQHVRHNPPRRERVWMATEQGRRDHIGQEPICLACEKGE